MLLAVAVATGCGEATSAPSTEPPPLKVTLPNGGTYAVGDAVHVAWEVGESAAALAEIHLQAVPQPADPLQRPPVALWSGENTGRATVRLPINLARNVRYQLRVQTHAASDAVAAAGIAPLDITPQSPNGLFALDQGITWKYSTGPASDPTNVSALPIDDEHPRRRILRRDSGYEEHFRLNKEGLFLEQINDPTVPFTLAFDPPLQLCASSVVIGESVHSSGTRLDRTPENEEPLQREYQAKVTVIGTQQIETPAGRFSTFKIQGTIITADAANVLFTLWLAPGVGRVQSVAFGTAPLSLVEYTQASPTQEDA